MRVFVTGGTGFIGRQTVDELRARGHRALVLSRETHRPERGIDFIKGDLSDIAAWQNKLKKFEPEAAVHLSWEGIPDFSYVQSMKNLEGSLALFALLADIGCKKIVATGTGFECGARTGKIDDDIAVMPEGYFTVAKHAIHLFGATLAKEKGMDFIWLRPFNPYGHGQRSGSLIPYIIRCAADAAPLTLKKPLAQGDFIYITDVAKIFADAVGRGKGVVTYNVGSGYLTPVRDIARIVCEEMGTGKPYAAAFLATAKGKLSPGPYAAIDKARKEIGWSPKVGIEEGIRKTVADYKKYLKK